MPAGALAADGAVAAVEAEGPWALLEDMGTHAAEAAEWQLYKEAQQQQGMLLLLLLPLTQPPVAVAALPAGDLLQPHQLPAAAANLQPSLGLHCSELRRPLSVPP